MFYPIVHLYIDHRQQLPPRTETTADEDVNVERECATRKKAERKYGGLGEPINDEVTKLRVGENRDSAYAATAIRIAR